MDSKQIQKKLSFVLYQEEKPPQYFEVKKNFLKFVFFAFPITLIFLISLVLVGALYFKKIKDAAIISSTHHARNDQLEQYQKQIQYLKGKINRPVEGIGSLGLFKQFNGQTDFSKKPFFSVEGTSYGMVDGKPRLQFALSNISDPLKKISGYLFVIIKSQNIIRVFPENAFLDSDFQTTYQKGEKFSFNRLRPFVITLSENTNLNNLNFKILIFSPSGDLLFDKNFAVSKK